MKILKILNQVARENTYLLTNDKASLIIDPGSNGSEIVAKIKEAGQPLVAILLTHTHYDHIMSVDLLRQEFDQPPVYVSDKEATWLSSPLDNLSGLDRHSDMADIIIAPAEHHFQYQDSYDLAGFHFDVVKTPGHSWGGVSFIFPQEEAVFSGDALFKETVGRTDLPTSNAEDLITGIRENLFSLPNHYQVYPGHGMNTRIGHEKNFNPFFKP